MHGTYPPYKMVIAVGGGGGGNGSFSIFKLHVVDVEYELLYLLTFSSQESFANSVACVLYVIDIPLPTACSGL